MTCANNVFSMVVLLPSFILFLPGIFKEHYVAIKEAQYINKETNNTTPLARYHGEYINKESNNTTPLARYQGGVQQQGDQQHHTTCLL